MSIYLAHSGGNGTSPQPYAQHIRQVCQRATFAAHAAGIYAAEQGRALEDVVRAASEYHDLGKLFEENQAALIAEKGGRHLPLNHVDAGTALFLERSDAIPALTVFSHHRGLPDLQAEFSREELALRDRDPELRFKTDHSLKALTSLHHQLVGGTLPTTVDAEPTDAAIFCRMALSCLVDGDHGDTAAQYQNAQNDLSWPKLHPAERLAALDRYVSCLGNGDIRSSLRDELYKTCRTAPMDEGFVFCDSPVGSGKTTALMAYLLHMAAEKGLRRIFVVLPFTNIITQSVEVYRKALVLPGEDPNLVVAELHHRAEFDDPSLRKLTALWHAPIVVTTAVAFFETLASNHPAVLRRLHELPGSAIFLDEAHTALPLKLIPMAWHWMTELAQHWSCHWLLASGSLVQFWQIPELFKPEESLPIPSLIPDALRARLADYEVQRIKFCWEPKAKSRRELISWVMAKPGPRLLIVNTIQTAAVLAQDICRNYGRSRVEHLSTALTPEDRATVLARVEKRLADKSDADWVLVATSCVEAGMNFSFRTGFREVASMLSLLQAAGRINRDGAFSDSAIWSFTLQDDRMIVPNKNLTASARIVQEYFKSNTPITPDLSTRSIQQELKEDMTIQNIIQYLHNQENALQFATVSEKFVAIDQDTVPAISDPLLVKQVRAGQTSWMQLQRKSFSIPRKRIERYHGEPLGHNLYVWTLPYDSFLGYMAGVIGADSISDCS